MTTRSSEVGDLPLPTFAREITGTLSIHSQFVLYGNIRERFLLADGPDGHGRLESIETVLLEALRPLGFSELVTFDPVHGFNSYPPATALGHSTVERLLGADLLNQLPSLRDLRVHLARLVGSRPPVSDSRHTSRPGVTPSHAGPASRIATVVDYASRILRQPDRLEREERDLFLACLKAADLAGTHVGNGDGASIALFNPVIWLVDSERDVPSWFLAGSPRIRSVAIAPPGLEERTRTATMLGHQMFGLPPEPSDEELRWIRKLAERTDGLSLRAVEEISRLARVRDIGLSEIEDAIRIYKLGVNDNPWRRASVTARIRQGEREVRHHVRGQERAVVKTLDILKRAALGLSGAQASSSATRPRGVLFFAGPTGTGKTELAKRVAKLLFGDEQAYLRFDMSEFAADHAADRLAGAPPGYIGYEAGGELTGAVRRQPFQVVLFDEIEKAHPLVMDKFLQILEDGRLTDGQGITTYFTECVLIFTSNLGVVRTDPVTKERKLIVAVDDPYPKLERTIRRGIKEHFTEEIGRPELLNRLGGNIVVFGFISERVAGEIFELQLSNIQTRLAHEHQITLRLTPDAERELRRVCTTDPFNGGRGIGNQLETNLINPLAREIFDCEIAPGHDITVTGIRNAQSADTSETDDDKISELPVELVIDVGGGSR